MRIDLTEVRNVLSTVDQILSRHHGQDVHNSSVIPQQAAIRLTGTAAVKLADDLRVVQDYLRLADAEISTLFWMSQGHEDPRRPTAGERPGVSRARASNSICGTAPSSRPTVIAPVRSLAR
jgi:hypothetical protein